ncbi:MAG: hypothetical protein LOD94_07650 [Gammaproteobacteria bacterium]|nr:hypothetical protein [Gammaproteobacteria bacterium]
MAQELTDADIAMDGANLYQEETFTDRRIGTLVRLTPVTANGARDPSRPVLYIGQTQVLTPAGALPISFEIDASSLEEAVAKFGRNAQEAVQSTIKRLEELRREAASSLIIPGSGAGPMGPSGPLGGPGGVRGGGIQLP